MTTILAMHDAHTSRTIAVLATDTHVAMTLAVFRMAATSPVRTAPIIIAGPRDLVHAIQPHAQLTPDALAHAPALPPARAINSLASEAEPFWLHLFYH